LNIFNYLQTQFHGRRFYLNRRFRMRHWRSFASRRRRYFASHWRNFEPDFRRNCSTTWGRFEEASGSQTGQTGLLTWTLFLCQWRHTYLWRQRRDSTSILSQGKNSNILKLEMIIISTIKINTTLSQLSIPNVQTLDTSAEVLTRIEMPIPSFWTYPLLLDCWYLTSTESWSWFWVISIVETYMSYFSRISIYLEQPYLKTVFSDFPGWTVSAWRVGRVIAIRRILIDSEIRRPIVREWRRQRRRVSTYAMVSLRFCSDVSTTTTAKSWTWTSTTSTKRWTATTTRVDLEQPLRRQRHRL